MSTQTKQHCSRQWRAGENFSVYGLDFDIHKIAKVLFQYAQNKQDFISICTKQPNLDSDMHKIAKVFSMCTKQSNHDSNMHKITKKRHQCDIFCYK